MRNWWTLERLSDVACAAPGRAALLPSPTGRARPRPSSLGELMVARALCGSAAGHRPHGSRPSTCCSRASTESGAGLEGAKKWKTRVGGKEFTLYERVMLENKMQCVNQFALRLCKHMWFMFADKFWVAECPLKQRCCSVFRCSILLSHPSPHHSNHVCRCQVHHGLASTEH